MVATAPWFNDVPDEAVWARLLVAWSDHLRDLWHHLGGLEASWSWGERTSVGLLANAAVAAGGFSMVELPVGAAPGNERFDLWVGFPAQDESRWGCHIEAKHLYAADLSDFTERARARLRWAEAQTQRLSWSPLRASVLLVTANPEASVTPTEQAARAHLDAIDARLRAAFGSQAGCFGQRFHVPDRVPRFPVAERERWFPGALLVGQVRHTETAG